MDFPSQLLDDFKNRIRLYPKIQPAYSYDTEKSINPAYCDIEHCSTLCLNEKRIWVLRTDLILAVGIKNRYVIEGNTNIFSKVQLCNKNPIDIQDPYGHPSLAMPEGDYDGSAYYAGWICQHASHMSVYLFTGRYAPMLCFEEQKKTIEEYISIQFMSAFGEQDIIFYDYSHERDMYAFLQGKSLDTYSRTYSPTHFENIKQYWMLQNNPSKNLLKQINAVDQNGYTFLHNAVRLGDIKFVKLLIKKGANRKIRTQITHHNKEIQHRNMTALDMVSHLKNTCSSAVLVMKNLLTPVNETNKENGSEIASACINHLHCVDYYFDEIKKLPREKKIKELTQNKLIRYVYQRQCSYAADCCIELLKTLPESELNEVLTSLNEDRKSISYYLLDNTEEVYAGDLHGEYRLKRYFALLQRVRPNIRAMILGLNLSENYTLSDKILHRCQNDAKLLCTYLILLENQPQLLSPYIHSLSQQLVFEYIRYMKDKSEQSTLLQYALSTQSALHAFLTRTPENNASCCARFFSNSYLSVHIAVLSELQKSVTAQNNSWFANTFQCFLPKPLNRTKLDTSKFNCGM